MKAKRLFGGGMILLLLTSGVMAIQFRSIRPAALAEPETAVFPPTAPVEPAEAVAVPSASISQAQVEALGSEAVRGLAGYQIYASRCTVCHGEDGSGTELGPPLNTAEIRERETAVLQDTINHGVPGTAMPSWNSNLSQSDVDALVAFLQQWDQLLQPEQQAATTHVDELIPDLLAMDGWLETETAVSSPAEELGAQLYATTCAACHGESGSGGTGPVLNSQQILTRNSDEMLAETIVNGSHRPNGSMPAFGESLTSAELDALVAYLRSWEPSAPLVDNPRGSEQAGGPGWRQAESGALMMQNGGQGRGPGWMRNEAERAELGQGPGEGRGPMWLQNED